MAGAISVEGLSKRFRHWEPNQAMTLQEVVLRGFRRRRRGYFWALSDVSFSVDPGRMVGIMGFNGAGKSTLLRLVAGVGIPDKGRVSIRGRLGTILDLGVGINPELTGRENIYVSGVCSGLTRAEVKERFDSIVEFSELGEFLDYPLRTYSSGMRVRLSFSVAVHIEPEVLLIDEVLAVGDLAFQMKCMDRMRAFKKSGCTGLIVSHAPQTVLDMCDDAIWLDRGRVVAYGAAREVVPQYIDATGVLKRLKAAEPGKQDGTAPPAAAGAPREVVGAPPVDLPEGHAGDRAPLVDGEADSGAASGPPNEPDAESVEVTGSDDRAGDS
jgi:lipopolysaccharide transport system ATP-binding protein